jgi:hypothetical protein
MANSEVPMLPEETAPKRLLRHHWLQEHRGYVPARRMPKVLALVPRYLQAQTDQQTETDREMLLNLPL